jgi:metalloprotease
MIKFLPVLMALAYALVMMGLSVWRTQKTLDQRSTALTDPALQAEVAPLARALDVPGIKMRIFDLPAVNALAAPDGKVYLTAGMLAAWRRGQITGPEIASVVAHELGHLSLGHLRRRMIDFTGQNAVFVLLTAFLSRWLPFIGVWIANQRGVPVAQIITELEAVILTLKAAEVQE